MTTSGSPDLLRAHVERLAGTIGERNVFHPRALRAAADYIATTWSGRGYRVTALPSFCRDGFWDNLEISCEGWRRPDEIVLVGAHYDSVAGSPGADDNASGVAALLELAALVRDARPERTVRLVAFANEEPPFFATREMGSDTYARVARTRGDDIRAMVALESIGCYSAAPGSQRYPPLLGLWFPARGDFLALVSNLRSRPLLRRAVAAFRDGATFPLRHLAAPSIIPGLAWSDHLSFWQQGYPALMATDTALYRNARYHTAADTPDTLDYPSLARVTAGLAHTIVALARSD